MRAARASRSSYSEPDAFFIINSKILSKTCLNKRSKDTVIKKEGKKKLCYMLRFTSITKGLPERVWLSENIDLTVLVNN